MGRRGVAVTAVAAIMVVVGYAAGVHRMPNNSPPDCTGGSCSQHELIKLYKADPLFDVFPAVGGELRGEFSQTNLDHSGGGTAFASMSRRYAVPNVASGDELLPEFDRAATAAGWRPWGPGKTGTNYCKQTGDRASFAIFTTTTQTPPHHIVVQLSASWAPGIMSYCTPQTN